jgi:hypothetical protein
MPLVLYTPRAQRTIKLAMVIAALFKTGMEPAPWLRGHEWDVATLSQTEEYLAAGVVVACASQPTLARLLELAGENSREFVLDLGVVLRFEVDAAADIIRYRETLA